MTSVTVLGSGGWIPTTRRATCCALMRDGDHAVVIDAGTGIGRLVEEPALLDGVRRLDLLLTHFHLDHVVGLAYLPALPVSVTVYGPGAWLYGETTERILGRLVGHPFFPVALADLVDGIEEIPEGGLELGGLAVRARVQRLHSDPTLALRLGEVLTYCTDTSYDEQNGDFAAGSQLLLHEAWYTEDAPREETTHSSALEAARVAAEAGVEGVVLIHIRPGADEPRLLEEALSSFKRTRIGTDLMQVT